MNPFTLAEEAAAAIAERTGRDQHDVAVVLGSGWLPAADALGSASHEIALSDLVGFPLPTVAGHAGKLRSLDVNDRSVLVFLGRSHLYEGHSPAAVVHAVRSAVLVGCRVVILTNAAGGLRADMSVGDPVLIRDHLNLMGKSPLQGEAPPEGYGARFVDLTDLYSKRLRELTHEKDPSLSEGVYAALPGPHYETPAEIAMLSQLGADLVGMSTVMEAIAARHLGAEVLAISLVTNLAAGLGHEGINHEDVIAAGQASAARVGALLASVISSLA